MPQQLFFGGPLHRAELESEEPADFVTFAEGKDDQQMNELSQLNLLGIAPPIGTPVAQYRAAARWEDDVIYLFVGGRSLEEDESNEE